MPGTSVTPTSSAAADAAAHPSAVSWSVIATTSSPARAAARTSSAGVSVPSLARECVCRSMRTGATLGRRNPVATTGTGSHTHRVSHFTPPPPPWWADDLLAAVGRAFVETGAGTPGWPDPHPDRRPLDEEYSRCLDPRKYAILGTRLDAWARVLTERGAAVEERDGPQRSFVPATSEALALLVVTTEVGGAPFGLEVRV